ncbi:MAG TPA: hypothetical protein VIJ63_20280 [Roseiarcus sp.]
MLHEEKSTIACQAGSDQVLFFRNHDKAAALLMGDARDFGVKASDSLIAPQALEIAQNGLANPRLSSREDALRSREK